MATIKRVEALKWIKDNPNVEFQIRFKKVDHTIRSMRAKSGFDDGALVKNPLKPAVAQEGVVKVYDVDKKEYRSFREDSLLSINTGEGWVDVEEARIIPIN